MLQETIVQFIDVIRRDKFRSESSVKTFLFALNRNLWLNELKKRGRADKRHVAFENMKPKDDPDVSEILADRETKQELIRMVGRLGEACRKILVLFYYENQSIREILASTDYDNEQVVRNKKHKCLKQLETMIREHPRIEKNLKNLLHG
jgi:RNA polymerase sigma factor (sigma-70 family)